MAAVASADTIPPQTAGSQEHDPTNGQPIQPPVESSFQPDGPVQQNVKPSEKPFSKLDVPTEKTAEGKKEDKGKDGEKIEEVVDDSDDSDAEATKESEKERKGYLADGAAARANDTEGDIPSDIKKVYRQAYPLIRRWWAGAKIPQSHEVAIKTINERIQKINDDWDNKNIYPGFINQFNPWLQKNHPDLYADILNGVKNDKIAKEEETKRAYFYSNGYKGPLRRPPGRYYLPREEILGQISSLGTQLLRLEGMQSGEIKKKNDEEYSKKDIEKLADDLIKGSLTFTKNMEQKGLDPKLTIPNNVKEQFDNLANESTKNQKTAREFMKVLTDPTTEQQAIWKKAAPDVKAFLTLATQKAKIKAGDVDKMNELLKSVDARSEELASLNKELSLLERDHMFPIKEMDAVKTAVMNETDVLRNLKKLKVVLNLNGQADLADMILPGRSLSSSNEKRRQYKLLMSVQDVPDSETSFSSDHGTIPSISIGTSDVQMDDTTISPPSDQSDMRANPISNIPRDATSFPPGNQSGTEASPPINIPRDATSFPPSNHPDTEASPPINIPRDATSFPPSNQSNTKASPPINIPRDASGKLFFDGDDGTIEMLNYEDGKTEFGALVAVRPTQSANPSYARFILNAGTYKRPYYRVVRGSELGPGGAQTLHDMVNMHTKFDVFERKQAARTAGRTTIKSIGPCVELPPDLTEQKTEKTKRPRRWDMYVRVEHYDNEKLNPLAKQRPNVEWLCRSEFERLVGKKYAERQTVIMLGKAKKRQEFAEECKRLGIHPDTQKALTHQDRVQTPWLFREEDSVFNTQPNFTEEDFDMDGIDDIDVM